MRRSYLSFLIILAMSGCQHLPGPGRPAPLPAGAPESGTVLADLARADRVVRNFSSGGTIVMELPGQAGRQRFNQSRVHFIAPARIYAKAFKLGQTVHIYVDGDTFLMDVPAENTFYFGHSGDHFPEVNMAIAPPEVLREFFLANTLAEIDPANVALVAYDARAARAELAIYPGVGRRQAQRVVVAELGPEGWEAVESRLLDPHGGLLASIHFEAYDRFDGVRLPGKTVASLANGEGELSYQIQSNPRVNRAEPIPIEAVAAVRANLIAKGYREVTGIPASGDTP